VKKLELHNTSTRQLLLTTNSYLTTFSMLQTQLDTTLTAVVQTRAGTRSLGHETPGQQFRTGQVTGHCQIHSLIRFLSSNMHTFHSSVCSKQYLSRQIYAHLHAD